MEIIRTYQRGRSGLVQQGCNADQEQDVDDFLILLIQSIQLNSICFEFQLIPQF